MRRLVMFLLSVLISPLCAQELVRIGTYSLPPFMMEAAPGKEVAGALVDYWEQYLAPAMGVRVVALGPFPVMRLQKMLEDGELDVIPNLTKVPSREAILLYPATPLSQITSCLVVPKDSPLTGVSRQEDLFGMTIGHLESGFVPPLLLHEQIAFDYVSGTDYLETLLAKIEAGRNDAFLHLNKVSLLYALATSGYADRVRVITLPVERQNVYCIFQKSARGKRLADAFDKAHAPYYELGIYDALAARYLD